MSLIVGSAVVLVIVLLTVKALGPRSGAAPGAAEPAPAATPSGSQPAAGPSRAAGATAFGSQAKNRKTAGSRIPRTGPGTFRPADVTAAPNGRRGALIRYNVRVERNLSFDPTATARFIHAVLNDRRSWGRSGQWRVQLVGPGAAADVRVYLATAGTTDRLCAPLQTGGQVSCFNEHRVVLNADRWTYGARSYRGRLTDYRRNVVNHEFGHALGHGHVGCPGKNRRAPIMMQQTKGLHGCRANPWPYPNA